MVRNTVIVATGSVIPEVIVPNSYFLNSEFYALEKEKGNYVRESKPIEEIIRTFEEITGIRERRYARKEKFASDIGAEALKNTRYDLNSLNYIICPNNFGDVGEDGRVNLVPSIAARIKKKVGITNPKTIAYDIAFGCPGWLEGVIQAHQLIQGGFAKRIAVIGTETLSKVCDRHDKDSMIYSDGAGVAILEARENENLEGILSFSHRTDSDYSKLIYMGPSNNPNYPDRNRLFLKMDGHEVFKYAVKWGPEVVEEALKKAGKTIKDLNMILIHQANKKLDDAILRRVELSEEEIEKVAPMTISWLGNSSVATLPTLLDLVSKGEMHEYMLKSGDLIAFASVGAGMNRNAVIYRMPLAA
jgi:3-oxoacyl-[acyl-carrier-protein] synthase-3